MHPTSKPILLDNHNHSTEIISLKEKTKLLKTNKKALEKFARETYRMKKENEVLYLFVDKK